MSLAKSLTTALDINEHRHYHISASEIILDGSAATLSGNLRTCHVHNFLTILDLLSYCLS
jgi:hypothetical protein